MGDILHILSTMVDLSTTVDVKSRHLAKRSCFQWLGRNLAMSRYDGMKERPGRMGQVITPVRRPKRRRKGLCLLMSGEPQFIRQILLLLDGLVQTI